MPFAAGSLSFQRFAVVGKAPKAVDQDLLDKAQEHRLRESGDEEDHGWTGGRHLLDAEFSFENNVFIDCLHLGLRHDTNRPPADLRRAYAAMEEKAATAGEGFVSKADKKDARDAADRRLQDEAKTGRFRRSRMAAVLWDLEQGVLYGPASATLQAKLADLFDRTFGLSLVPLTAGNLALRRLESTGRRRDYEDARPTRFAEQEGEADYPWATKVGGGKDWIGNEFLLWLWHAAEHDGGGIEVKDGIVTAFVDKSLDLDCAFGQTGRGTLRGDGPGRMPEARHALRVGKAPRKLGLVLDGPAAYSLALAGETLAVSGLALPDVDADSPRVAFEERVGHLRDFARTLDALFDAFLAHRAGGSWAPRVRSIRDWIARNTQPKRAA